MSFEIVVDALLPSKLAAFWSQTLPGYHIRPYDAAEIERLASLGYTPETDPSVAIDGDGPTIWFQKVDAKPQARNRIHLDLKCADEEAETKRLTNLGATVRDVTNTIS